MDLRPCCALNPNDFPFQPADPRLAWLPAVLPASARALEPPDVEIGAVEDLRGTARVAFVPFSSPVPEEHPVRLVRGGQRVWRSLLARTRAARAAARLERLGYSETEVVSWEVDRELGGGRFPLGALAVGRREPGNSLLLELTGGGLTRPPLLREGAAVALTEDSVFRISIGRSRPVDGQLAALELLGEGGPSSLVAERIPWPTASRTVDLAHWSREPRLPGEAPAELGDGLLDDCVIFLGGLFESKVHARASALGSPSEPAVSAVAERVRALALPRGFGHGDFHRGNLLVSGGRLTGVVDWDAAGPGRLPLLDYLHLIATEDYLRHRRNLGPTIVEFLLPWARAGGDERARGLLSRVNVEATPRLLEDLVAASWLDFVEGDLAKSADRAARPRWMRENVDLVARALR